MLELKAEAVPEGIQRQLDAVAERGVPGYGPAVRPVFFCGDNFAPLYPGNGGGVCFALAGREKSVPI
jgi:hypothetical protein